MSLESVTLQAKLHSLEQGASHLDLFSFSLSDDEYALLMTALELAPHLRGLNLRSTGLTPLRAKMLAYALRNHKSLAYLNLAQNRLDAASLKELTRGPIELYIVDLSGNPLGPESAAVLSEFISASSSLKSLFLRDLGWSSSQLVPVIEALATTRSLTTLDLAGNDVSLELLPTLRQARRSSKSLINLLTHYVDPDTGRLSNARNQPELRPATMPEVEQLLAL